MNSGCMVLIVCMVILVIMIGVLQRSREENKDTVENFVPYTMIRQLTIPKMDRADVFVRNTNEEISIQKDVEFNATLNVKDKFKLGDVSLMTNQDSNIRMGKGNVDMEINKSTLFTEPVLFDENMKSLTMNAYAHIDGKTHMYEDMVMDDKFCFLNSNDENCLTLPDVELMGESSNYIDKASVLMSACISKDGLQGTSDSYLTSKNIPLDDEMVCVRKKDTYAMLNDWSNITENLSKQSDTKTIETPSNICTKEDIETREVYKYGGNEYTNQNDLQSAINQNECNNCALCRHTNGGSCIIEVDYEKQLEFINRNRDTCDFQNTTTRLNTLTHRCPPHPHKYYLGGVCYTLTSITTDDILEKKTKFKSGTAYIGDWEDGKMKLGDKQKEFRIREYAEGYRVTNNRQEWYQLFRGDSNYLEIKDFGDNGRGDEFKFFKSNSNTYLIKVGTNGWLRNDSLSLSVGSQPNIAWTVEVD